MRVAALDADHRFEIVDIPDPSPGTGELVLRVTACGICGSDLKMHKVMPSGTVLGPEFCGEVVAVGSEASPEWRVGDAVAGLPLTVCGRCRWCLADDPAHCERVLYQGVGGPPGAFAEYVAVEARSAVRLAEGAGEYGALVEPLAVGLHAVAAGGLRPGDRVLVIGGGNVGASVSMWARRFGAGEIVVSDPSATRRESAATFGASGVHDPSEGPAPGPFDVVYECVGATGLVQAAVDAAAVRGRVVIAGVCMVADPFVPITAVMKEVEMRFAVYYRHAEFAAAAQLLGSGGFDAPAFVSSRVGLDGVDDAFDRLLATDTERKVLVTPHG